nr:coat protein 2 [Camellia virus A]
DVNDVGSFDANQSGLIRENVVLNRTWKATDRNLLFSLVVHPCSSYKSSRMMIPTSLAMVSSLYHYWRGSLVYRFYFGCNAFTTGKLHVGAIPGAFITENPDSRIVMGLGGTVFDLSDSKPYYEFSVPFFGIGYKQRTCRSYMFDSMFYGEDVVTRMHAWIVDPLITNVGATEEIYLCVTVQPGDDFMLDCPRGMLYGVPAMKVIPEADVVAERINT